MATWFGWLNKGWAWVDHRPVRTRPPKVRRQHVIPRLDLLEDRTVPSTFTVTNLSDSAPGSLRAEIALANAHPGADVIQFAPGLHGTISLASELGITDALTINGPGANQVTVSGNNDTRVFHVSTSSPVALNNLTIANGLASDPVGPAFGGGLLNEGGDVTLSKDVFAGNQAQSSAGYVGGGAIANIAGAHLTADQTDFAGNTASGTAANFGNGGAVYDDQQAMVVLTHSTFSDNLATGGQANGGAIGHYGGSQLTLDHCSFDGNQALALPPGSDAFGLNAAGGAIESDNASGFFELDGSELGSPIMTITHCSFTANLAHAVAAGPGVDGAATEGGAMDVDAGAIATVSNSLFANNQAIGGDGGDGGSGGRTLGGAILVFGGGDLTVSNSLFNGNVSHGGNGGDGGDGARADGGAITSTLGSILTISNCSLMNNTAQGGAGGVGGHGGVCRGGGLANEGGAQAIVSNTSIVNNQALGGAGGAGGDGGNAVGGGVYNGRRLGDQAASLELINCTVSANQAQGGAGGLGGNGGFARGGGIYNGNTTSTGDLDPSPPPPILDLDGTNVTANRAVGGEAGSGGLAGTGVGGGLYNDSVDGAVAEADAHTHIKGNKATTSDDDVFGLVTPA